MYFLLKEIKIIKKRFLTRKDLNYRLYPHTLRVRNLTSLKNIFFLKILKSYCKIFFLF